jgi:hypothetical protein
MTEPVNDAGNSKPEVIEDRKKVSKISAQLLRATPLIIALVALSFSIWNAYTTRKAIDELEWADAVASNRAPGNEIVPDVGTIQFLKNGYSISLEDVSYNANGLYMSGYIGNPTNLTLSNLTIQFTARQPIYSVREAFMKASPNSLDRIFISPEQIGTAQTKPISSLSPGMREHFDVTIPNVKQTKDSIDIRISFTGERYSYRP